MRILRLTRLIGVLVIAYLSTCLGAGILLTEAAVHPGRRALVASDEARVRQLAHNFDAEVESVTVQAKDGAVLRAWSIVPHPDNGNSVILLHGLSDNRMGMIRYAELLLSHGYGVLMPDSRAHGQSGGRFATYGLLERDDIQQWIVWVYAGQHPSCVYGFGESMGAAQLLQTLELQPGLCAVAAESPFSNFREIAYDRVGQFFHGGTWIGRFLFRPTVEVALVYASRKYGFDFQKISPEDSVGKSQIPVFLIHGAVDHNIPVRHSERIRDRNPRVTLWEAPNADHCGAISTDPDQFVVKLLAWFRARCFTNYENPLFPRNILEPISSEIRN